MAEDDLLSGRESGLRTTIAAFNKTFTAKEMNKQHKQKEFTKTLAQFMDKMEDEHDAKKQVRDQIMKENI